MFVTLKGNPERKVEAEELVQTTAVAESAARNAEAAHMTTAQVAVWVDEVVTDLQADMNTFQGSMKALADASLEEAKDYVDVAIGKSRGECVKAEVAWGKRVESAEQEILDCRYKVALLGQETQKRLVALDNECAQAFKTMTAISDHVHALNKMVTLPPEPQKSHAPLWTATAISWIVSLVCMLKVYGLI